MPITPTETDQKLFITAAIYHYLNEQEAVLYQDLMVAFSRHCQPGEDDNRLEIIFYMLKNQPDVRTYVNYLRAGDDLASFELYKHHCQQEFRRTRDVVGDWSKEPTWKWDKNNAATNTRMDTAASPKDVYLKKEADNTQRRINEALASDLDIDREEVDDSVFSRARQLAPRRVLTSVEDFRVNACGSGGAGAAALAAGGAAAPAAGRVIDTDSAQGSSAAEDAAEGDRNFSDELPLGTLDFAHEGALRHFGKEPRASEQALTYWQEYAREYHRHTALAGLYEDVNGLQVIRKQRSKEGNQTLLPTIHELMFPPEGQQSKGVMAESEKAIAEDYARKVSDFLRDPEPVEELCSLPAVDTSKQRVSEAQGKLFAALIRICSEQSAESPMLKSVADIHPDETILSQKLLNFVRVSVAQSHRSEFTECFQYAQACLTANTFYAYYDAWCGQQGSQSDLRSVGSTAASSAASTATARDEEEDASQSMLVNDIYNNALLAGVVLPDAVSTKLKELHLDVLKKCAAIVMVATQNPSHPFLKAEGRLLETLDLPGFILEKIGNSIAVLTAMSPVGTLVADMLFCLENTSGDHQQHVLSYFHALAGRPGFHDFANAFYEMLPDYYNSTEDKAACFKKIISLEFPEDSGLFELDTREHAACISYVSIMYRLQGEFSSLAECYNYVSTRLNGLSTSGGAAASAGATAVSGAVGAGDIALLRQTLFRLRPGAEGKWDVKAVRDGLVHLQKRGNKALFALWPTLSKYLSTMLGIPTEQVCPEVDLQKMLSDQAGEGTPLVCSDHSLSDDWVTYYGPNNIMTLVQFKSLVTLAATFKGHAKTAVKGAWAQVTAYVDRFIVRELPANEQELGSGEYDRRLIDPLSSQYEGVKPAAELEKALNVLLESTKAGTSDRLALYLWMKRLIDYVPIVRSIVFNLLQKHGVDDEQAIYRCFVFEYVSEENGFAGSVPAASGAGESKAEDDGVGEAAASSLLVEALYCLPIVEIFWRRYQNFCSWQDKKPVADRRKMRKTAINEQYKSTMRAVHALKTFMDTLNKGDLFLEFMSLLSSSVLFEGRFSAGPVAWFDKDLEPYDQNRHGFYHHLKEDFVFELPESTRTADHKLLLSVFSLTGISDVLGIETLLQTLIETTPYLRSLISAAWLPRYTEKREQRSFDVMPLFAGIGLEGGSAKSTDQLTAKWWQITGQPAHLKREHVYASPEVLGLFPFAGVRMVLDPEDNGEFRVREYANERALAPVLLHLHKWLKGLVTVTSDQQKENLKRLSVMRQAITGKYNELDERGDASQDELTYFVDFIFSAYFTQVEEAKNYFAYWYGMHLWKQEKSPVIWRGLGAAVKANLLNGSRDPFLWGVINAFAGKFFGEGTVTLLVPPVVALTQSKPSAVPGGDDESKDNSDGGERRPLLSRSGKGDVVGSWGRPLLAIGRPESNGWVSVNIANGQAGGITLLPDHSAKMYPASVLSGQDPAEVSAFVRKHLTAFVLASFKKLGIKKRCFVFPHQFVDLAEKMFKELVRNLTSVEVITAQRYKIPKKEGVTRKAALCSAVHFHEGEDLTLELLRFYAAGGKYASIEEAKTALLAVLIAYISSDSSFARAQEKMRKKREHCGAAAVNVLTCGLLHSPASRVSRIAFGSILLLTMSVLAADTTHCLLNVLPWGGLALMLSSVWYFTWANKTSENLVAEELSWLNKSARLTRQRESGEVGRCSGLFKRGGLHLQRHKRFYGINAALLALSVISEFAMREYGNWPVCGVPAYETPLSGLPTLNALFLSISVLIRLGYHCAYGRKISNTTISPLFLPRDSDELPDAGAVAVVVNRV